MAVVATATVTVAVTKSAAPWRAAARRPFRLAYGPNSGWTRRGGATRRQDASRASRSLSSCMVVVATVAVVAAATSTAAVTKGSAAGAP